MSVYVLTVVNRNSAKTAYTIKAWLDAAVSGLELSADGSTWSAPTSEATAVDLGDLAPAASVSLHVQRTVDPGATADPEVLNLIHTCFLMSE